MSRSKASLTKKLGYSSASSAATAAPLSTSSLLMDQLIEAARLDREAIAKELLFQPDVDVNGADTEGWRPLHRACFNGSLRVACLLLQHPRVDLNLPTGRRQPQPGDTAATVAATNNCEFVPLSIAVCMNRLNILPHLLAQPRLDVNAALPQQTVDATAPTATRAPRGVGWTAVHYACHRGHAPALELLLAHPDVDVTVRNEQGETPYDLAVKEGHQAVLQILQTHLDATSTDHLSSAHDAALLQAVRKGHVTTVRHLLRDHPDVNVNVQYVDGTSVLHVAARYGLAIIVNCLCQHPALCVNVRDANGWTALHWACRGQHQNVVDCLLDHRDVDVAARSKEHQTPLDVCPVDASHQLRTTLWHVTHEKDHPHYLLRPCEHQLLLAVQAGRRVEVEYLLQQNNNQKNSFNINAAGFRGRTVLHVAARNGNRRLVELLGRQPGLDWGTRDDQGRTALHEACRWHDTLEVVDHLVRRMTADQINAPDNEGHTALHVAVMGKNTDAMRLLVRHAESDLTQALHSHLERYGVKFLQVFQNKTVAHFLERHVAHKLDCDMLDARGKSIMDRAQSVTEDRELMTACLRETVDELEERAAGGQAGAGDISPAKDNASTAGAPPSSVSSSTTNVRKASRELSAPEEKRRRLVKVKVEEVVEMENGLCNL